MRELLKGLIDVHVHAGPSVANRKVDIAEMARLAMDAGYRAFVAKDHYFPTMMGAKMIEKHMCDGKLQIFGCIALNNSVGGFNLNTVDAANGLGAKFIYFPTLSARQHIEEHKRSTVLQPFPGAGNQSVSESPIYYLTENGELKDEVVKVIEYLAKNPHLIMATGHGTPEEIDAAVAKAVELGVRKIYITHPHYCVNAPLESIAKWAKRGCYVEMNVAAAEDMSPYGIVPMTFIAKMFEVVPMNRMVLCSDLGQNNSPDPVSGMLAFFPKLMEIGLTEADINMIGKSNPAALLGI